MDNNNSTANAKTVSAELHWLRRLIDTRMKIHWSQPADYHDVLDITPPDISNDPSLYASVVKHYQMDISERLTLILSLTPHVMPQLLDVFFSTNTESERGFTEFGGIKNQQHPGFLPTGETVSFILASTSLEKRFNLLNIFSESHFFKKFKILKLVNTNPGEPYLSGALGLSVEYLNYFTNGELIKPVFSIDFPAKLLHTELDWSDLVLNDEPLLEIQEISNWIKYGNTILNDWGMKKTIKAGYRALFHGPGGTGKTLTASLLGKANGLNVYKIDLSMVVSKYIGETEKNLANIFDQAADKNWILFFDEADALFGKRTKISDSHDRYANQEISYLLQRIEDYPGVVIVSTNIKKNLDDAFIRRFQSTICFSLPNADQRKRLWTNAFSKKSVLEAAVSLDDIAANYELTGGAIVDIARHCSLVAISRDSNIILLKDIEDGIKRELKKEEKIIQ